MPRFFKWKTRTMERVNPVSVSGKRMGRQENELREKMVFFFGL